MAYQARVLYDFQVNAVIVNYSMLQIAENFQTPFKHNFQAVSPGELGVSEGIPLHW